MFINAILSEDELVEPLKTGKSDSLRVLYQMYSEALFYAIIKIVRNKQIAEETLQMVWVRVWSESGNYDPERGRIYTWLLSIARNAAIDVYRSKAYKNLKKNSCLEDCEEWRKEFRAKSYNPDLIGLRQIVAERLEHQEKEVLQLVYFEGYTHTEAAHHLEMPLGTVKTRLGGALKKLRDYFSEEGDEVGRSTAFMKKHAGLRSSGLKSSEEIKLAMGVLGGEPQIDKRFSKKREILPRVPAKNRRDKPKKASKRNDVIRLYRLGKMGMVEIAETLGIKPSLGYYYVRNLPKTGSLGRCRSDVSVQPRPKPLKAEIREMAMKIKKLHDLNTMTHVQIACQLDISVQKVGRYLFALNRWEAYQSEEKENSSA